MEENKEKLPLAISPVARPQGHVFRYIRNPHSRPSLRLTFSHCRCRVPEQVSGPGRPWNPGMLVIVPVMAFLEPLRKGEGGRGCLEKATIELALGNEKKPNTVAHSYNLDMRDEGRRITTSSWLSWATE